MIMLLPALMIGAAAGYIGSFMVVKRMALVGDALSHVALPGIALALTFGISPFLGAFMALFVATIGIWYFEETSVNYPEALVGVFFTASLALGILITPEPEMLEALFGTIERITPVEAVMAVIFASLVMYIGHLISSKLILSVISKDLTQSLRVNTHLINLIFLMLVSSIVALGVRFVGTLLMGALVIIPAASARNLSHNLTHYTALAIIFGIISACLGVTLAFVYQLPSGPVVAITSVIIFLGSYFFKR